MDGDDVNGRVGLTNGDVGPVDSLLTGFLLNGHGCVRVEAVEEVVVEGGREGVGGEGRERVEVELG